MDRESVADLLWNIEGLYSGKVKVEDDIARLNIWAEVLAEQDAEIVFANLKKYAQSNAWPPNVSDLVGHVSTEKRTVPSYEETMNMIYHREPLREPEEVMERSQHLENIRKILGI